MAFAKSSRLDLWEKVFQPELDETFRSEATSLTPIRVFELRALPLELRCVHLSVSSDCFNGLLRDLEPTGSSVAIFSQGAGYHPRQCLLLLNPASQQSRGGHIYLLQALWDPSAEIFKSQGGLMG